LGGAELGQLHASATPTELLLLSDALLKLLKLQRLLAE
jgi:hypothetical protein